MGGAPSSRRWVMCWLDHSINEEDILYADLDLAEVARDKFDFDVVGHYARPDVFQLVVNEKPMSPVI